jgi:hypothetical protein
MLISLNWGIWLPAAVLVVWPVVSRLILILHYENAAGMITRPICFENKKLAEVTKRFIHRPVPITSGLRGSFRAEF